MPSPKKPSNSIKSAPVGKLIAVSSIAAGIQFGWALQLSLLTPYVQLLGVPHSAASFIWLCGPVSGMIVQPLVGYYSDRSTSRFGRRKPFILAGAISVAIAVFLIGYAADLGHSFGDDLSKKTKPRSVVIFVLGFWILDVANNMLQGPCRAFLGDLSAGDQEKTRTANAFFSFFMAVGNILGYAAGSYSELHTFFPFSQTKACDVFCANLKSCFFFSIFLLLVLAIFVLVYVEDTPKTSEHDGLDDETQPPCFGQLVTAFKELDRPMWILMGVTALNWFAWFPFFLFDTDWMGREVYGGEVGTVAYDTGVRAGSLGLMINAVVLAMMSLGIEPVGKVIGGSKKLWGTVNFILAIAMACTVYITKVAEHDRRMAGVGPGVYVPPSLGVKAGALTFFAVLGIPMAITFSIPFALASIYSSSSGAGQGLSLGVLNLAIVIPQMIVSALSGPWDALFGGGNLPAFVVGAVVAAISGVMAIILLPTPAPSEITKTSASIGGFH